RGGWSGGGVRWGACAVRALRSAAGPRGPAPQPPTKARFQQARAQPPQQPPAPAANGDPGNLSASGYVVARRKATVAAEITGKVTEIFVDEGMTVAKGDVVAQLDSVLVEKDLELARSRIEAADAAIA